MKKEIYNHTGYYVYEDGRVYSELKKRFLPTPTDKRGYKSVSIQGKRYRLHRIVCITYFPINNPEKFVVNHIDENPSNNNISNLEWCTQRENVRKYYYSTAVSIKERKRRRQLMLKPSKTPYKRSHTPIYKHIKLEDIQRLRSEGKSYMDIGKFYGVSNMCIYYRVKKSLL